MEIEQMLDLHNLSSSQKFMNSKTREFINTETRKIIDRETQKFIDRETAIKLFMDYQRMGSNETRINSPAQKMGGSGLQRTTVNGFHKINDPSLLGPISGNPNLNLKTLENTIELNFLPEFFT